MKTACIFDRTCLSGQFSDYWLRSAKKMNMVPGDSVGLNIFDDAFYETFTYWNETVSESNPILMSFEI